MALSLRSAAVFTLASAFFLSAVAPACSQQGEGERCDRVAAGDSDCDSGLVCVEEGKLLDGSTDRCCPPDGSYSDSRCTLDTGVGGSGGSGGSGVMTDAGAAGVAAGGMAPDEVGGSGGSGGSPPDPVAGQGGQLGTAGAPVSESGAPSVGGVPSLPLGGQGGAE